MNQLNSLILEGTVTKSAVYEDEKASFTISVARYYKDTNGEIGEIKSYFDVVTGGAPAEKLHKKLTEGRVIRIVGQLRSENVNNTNRVYIHAEHIEIKEA